MHTLYAITPGFIAGSDQPDAVLARQWADRLLACVAAALDAGLQLLQYRSKPVFDKGLWVDTAAAMALLCQKYDADFIINDDLNAVVQLSQQVHVAGIHLGRDDASIEAGRAALGPMRLVGASCYADLDRARQALQAGASYVAFGAVFPSQTKTGATACPLALLKAAVEEGMPTVAIGGIDLERAPVLYDLGVSSLAVCQALFGDEQSPSGLAKETVIAARVRAWLKLGV